MDESRSYVLTDISAGEQPTLVFTGNTLFVGDMGRTDLYGLEEAPRLAGNLYDSIFKKLLHRSSKVFFFLQHLLPLITPTISSCSLFKKLKYNDNNVRIKDRTIYALSDIGFLMKVLINFDMLRISMSVYFYLFWEFLNSYFYASW
jgi:hypothetical protein